VRENAHQLLERIKASEKKKGNILEYRMEEMGPMGNPLGGPTYCASYV
jgi:hypothetical protein